MRDPKRHKEVHIEHAPEWAVDESVGLGQPSGRHCDGILPLTRSVSIPGPAEVSHLASEGLALVDGEPALVTDSGQCREIKGSSTTWNQD